ncbi:MAG: AAA family ATPase [Rhodocyclaceae bacterium]|nr:AAA family ATPase [Rhodocyclaceae bacterium]
MPSSGYLVLDAAKVLTQPYARKASSARAAFGAAAHRIARPGSGFASALCPEPEGVPLNVRTIAGGRADSPVLPAQEYDPGEFDKLLFQVGADFRATSRFQRTNTRSYGRFLGMLARHYGLRPLRPACCRGALIRHSARLAGDWRLSASTRRLSGPDAGGQPPGRQGRTPDRHARGMSKLLWVRRHRAKPPSLRSMQEQILRDNPLICRRRNVGQVNSLAVIGTSWLHIRHRCGSAATARIGEAPSSTSSAESELGGAIPRRA